MSLGPYKYSPLKSIRSVRFVKLLPGKDNVIDCELFEANIDDGVSFTALSYAWDISTTVAVKFIIALAAHLDERSDTAHAIQTRVRHEEWQAFRRYLGRSWFQRMWVVQELVLGLKMSGPNATLVICGPDAVLWAELVHACNWAYGNYPAELTSPERAALTNAVRQGVERVLFLHEMAMKAVSSETRSQNWMQLLTSNIPIVRSRQASDPRDKVFALYGLCNVGLAAVPDYTLSTPEVYREFAFKSITQLQSLDVLHEVEKLQPRYLGDDLPSWVPDWSTLLDRISFRERTDFAASSGLSIDPLHASQKIALLESPNARMLRLDGILADEILFTTDVLTATSLSELGVENGKNPLIAVIWDYKAKHLDPYPTGEPTFTCYVRTLIANSHDERLTDFIHDAALFWESIRVPTEALPKFVLANPSSGSLGLPTSLKEWTTMVMKSLLLGRANSAWLLRRIGPILITSTTQNRINKITAPGMRSYKELLLKWAQGRVFFTTKNGYMGLGVAGTRTGDIVAILLSGRTPFVLRQQPGILIPKDRIDARAFSLVGEAYVHGFMNGEAVRLGNFWETVYLV